MNQTRSRLTISAALLWTSAAIGCAGSAANTPEASTAKTAQAADNDDIADGLNDHHQHHHHGGVTMLIALSLDTLGVPPEQRAAIDQIRNDLHAAMQPARAAEETLHSLLADGIATGAIDHAKVDAALAEITTHAAAVHDATVDALNRLHAALTPPQRAALVDKVEAHWEVWQHANTVPAPPGERGPLVVLAAEVGLRQDQVDKIRATLVDEDKTVPAFDPQAVLSHVRSFGDAFRADTFDAKTNTTRSAVDARVATFGASRMVHFYEAVDPVLTPEQRVKVAAILREHASYNPNGQGA